MTSSLVVIWLLKTGVSTLCWHLLRHGQGVHFKCAGDELKLKHTCSGPQNKAWQGLGTVIRLDEASEEVCQCLHATECQSYLSGRRSIIHRMHAGVGSDIHRPC